jgi:hypothetical protein
MSGSGTAGPSRSRRQTWLGTAIRILHSRGDFIRAVEFLVAREDLDGVVNLVPEPLRNCDFLRVPREAWGASFGLPNPEWLLELGAVFMRTDSELVLKAAASCQACLLEFRSSFHFATGPPPAVTWFPAGVREIRFTSCVENWASNNLLRSGKSEPPAYRYNEDRTICPTTLPCLSAP